MANTIALAKSYIPIIDEVYKNVSVTADLNSDPSLARAGASVKEILIPKVSVTGLGDYDRNAGYTDASVTFEWETRAFNYDRGARIKVDAMDAEETLNEAFVAAGSALQREKVAPEADAFCFAALAGHSGISKVAAGVTYADGAEFLAGLLAASIALDEAEVPAESRILYVTPTLLGSVKALDTTKSREALNAFSIVKPVPQSRFYTAIDLLDGKTAGEEAGHYIKNAATGKDINFMIVEKSAVIKFDKHTASSIITPDQSEQYDAYISKYRKYGIVDVFDNKAVGIYLSHKA